MAEPDRRFDWRMDLRYAGQAFDLRRSTNARFGPAGLEAAAAHFHALHRRRFSYDSQPRRLVELVALRLAAVGRLAKPAPDASGAAPAAATPKTRRAWARGGFVDTAVWARSALGERAVAGPAVIEETYTSSYAPPGWEARLERSGALVARRIADQ